MGSNYLSRLDISLREIAFWLLIIPASFFMAQQNYVLFHAVVESFSILVAAFIFDRARDFFRKNENYFILFLGIAFFYTAVFDFLHLISYKGMEVFRAFDPDIPTQLWIAGRYILAGSFLLAPTFLNREFPPLLIHFIYFVITTSLLASILCFDLFPACFIEGQGLTLFKIVSEYIISLIFVGSILRLWLHMHKGSGSLYLIILAAMVISILAELSFTLYIDVYGFMNYLGHIFKVVSYYLIFKEIVLHRDHPSRDYRSL